MKRVFWLLSAVSLTVAQSSAAQSAYSNSSTQSSYVTSIPDDIDSVINDLIANSQNAQVHAYHQPTSTTTIQNFSTNFQSPVSAVERLTASSAPSVAAAVASRAALGRSVGRCALYVRKALQSAGYEFTPQPSAYQYAHGTLASAGFTKLNDGSQWVSDFRQPKFSPYSQHNGYSVWRDARYNDASANTGIMLALNEQ